MPRLCKIVQTFTNDVLRSYEKISQLPTIQGMVEFKLDGRSSNYSYGDGTRWNISKSGQGVTRWFHKTKIKFFKLLDIFRTFEAPSDILPYRRSSSCTLFPCVDIKCSNSRRCKFHKKNFFGNNSLYRPDNALINMYIFSFFCHQITHQCYRQCFTYGHYPYGSSLFSNRVCEKSLNRLMTKYYYFGFIIKFKKNKVTTQREICIF